MNKPLTDEEIKALYDKTSDELYYKWKRGEGTIFRIEFARAVEQAHGIRE